MLHDTRPDGKIEGPKIFRGQGPSINYVVSVGGKGGSPKDNLLHRPYLIKRRQEGEGQKLPILRRHSLWTAPQQKNVGPAKHRGTVGIHSKHLLVAT